ncbi:MAG: AAA family ATPase [Flavobacterium sp.]|nr:AAA family ATPase [Flavobacterium sp.]
MIDRLVIKNFKSINHINLECGRINVLIGEPNAGKSNILEALDLSFLSWMFNINDAALKAGKNIIDLKNYFRTNDVSGLFHFGEMGNPISIIQIRENGFHEISLKYIVEKEQNIYQWSDTSSFTEFDKDFIPVTGSQYFASTIKPFRYKDDIQFHNSGNYVSNFMPPYGNNLLDVIQHNASFRDTIKTLTEDYGFEFNIDRVSNQLFIQIRINEGIVYSIPYKGIADTFKRVLFYLAAIRYNNAQVVTLDEPDAHSFPKYVSFLADEIIKKKSTQFFITTHNPYLLNHLIENTPLKDLAVFVCSYNKDTSSTDAKKLTEQDLSEMLDYGIDVFFNINKYIDGRVEYNS